MLYSVVAHSIESTEWVNLFFFICKTFNAIGLLTSVRSDHVDKSADCSQVKSSQIFVDQRPQEALVQHIEHVLSQCALRIVTPGCLGPIAHWHLKSYLALGVMVICSDCELCKRRSQHSLNNPSTSKGWPASSNYILTASPLRPHSSTVQRGDPKTHR